MQYLLYPLPTVFTGLLLAAGALALEPMTDEQLSQVQGQGQNLMFQNIRFEGETGPNGEPAGQLNLIGTDGSRLGLERLSFTADALGTRALPLTVGALTQDATVNSLDGTGNVVADGQALGDRTFLHIGLPAAEAWQNVDLQFDAVYGNPTQLDTQNPNIAAGGTPSTDHEGVGMVTLDDIAISGSLGIAGIPAGFKIRSQAIQDGSASAESRQGLLLNIAIDRLAINRWLLEAQNPDGVFDPTSDLLLEDFEIGNLHLKSATLETTPQGLRFAYSDPQPFTADGMPDTGSPAYDASRPKASLNFTTRMTHSQVNTSRIEGMTLDHLVFTVDN